MDVAEADTNACESQQAPGASVHGQRIDPALHGLVLLAQFHGIAADAAQLRHAAGRGDTPFDDTSLLQAAKSLGLKARIVSKPAGRLNRVALPALALGADGDAFVVANIDADKILIHDLEQQRPVVLSREDFQGRYQGRLLTVASRASMVAELAPSSNWPYTPWAASSPRRKLSWPSCRTVSAEIKTGKRRVIDYLLSPLETHVDEAMRER